MDSFSLCFFDLRKSRGAVYYNIFGKQGTTVGRARSWLFLKFDSGHSVGSLRSKRISGVDSVLPSSQIQAFDLMSFIHGICALVFN